MLRKIEMKIYELMGIKMFRLLVLKLEKLIHRKDRGQNTNYHIDKYKIGSIDGFVKYLFYNGFIHVKNILLISGWFAIRLLLKSKLTIIDYFLIAFLIKDVYCVILQRYSFLRIRMVQERINEKRKETIQKCAKKNCERFKEMYNWENREMDTKLIRSIIERMKNRESVVLGEYELSRIKNMTALLVDKE